ncbi:glycosyltransferase family 2 protein [Pararhizobium sp. DWP3-4]|uniref:glycosyltransferase family 2 protein n=1 Tax=unclassified Pararhizobium TaxID=2643050 RepID=UPI003CF15E6F
MDASIKQREFNRIAPAPMIPRKLSIVAVTYNSASVLPGLLDSLRAGLEGIEEYEVIVVDNDSYDDSIAIAHAHPIGARVIATGRNGGYSAGINTATATIEPLSDLLVLNPDIRLQPGSISRLYAGLSSSSVGVAVPQVRGEDGVIAKSIRREPSLATAWSEALLGGRLAARLGLGEMVASSALYQEGGPIEWATGAILLVTANARAVIGEWDDSFFLYSEEVDYLQRARAAGLDVLYVPSSQAIHIGGDYHSSDFLTALMTANRIKYYRRHHGALASALFRSGIVVGETMRLAIGTGRRATLSAALRF